jgi:hypothetical protein
VVSDNKELDSSNTGNASHTPYTAIDPNANQPKALSTPLPEKTNSDNITPDQGTEVRDLGKLPGFIPGPKIDQTLSTPEHITKVQDLILTKDYDIKHWNVKPASVKEAPEVWQHGKFGKIYKDPEQKADSKEIWWSKDTAKHGGGRDGLTPSTYKLYVENNKIFEWIADVDATGKVIEDKNRGDVGRNIPIKQCWKVK